MKYGLNLLSEVKCALTPTCIASISRERATACTARGASPCSASPRPLPRCLASLPSASPRPRLASRRGSQAGRHSICPRRARGGTGAVDPPGSPGIAFAEAPRGPTRPQRAAVRTEAPPLACASSLPDLPAQVGAPPPFGRPNPATRPTKLQLALAAPLRSIPTTRVPPASPTEPPPRC